MDSSELDSTLPRLLAVEVLLAQPETLGDDVLETCLYIFRDRLRGTDVMSIDEPDWSQQQPDP